MRNDEGVKVQSQTGREPLASPAGDTAPMTPAEFAAKWAGSQRAERAAAQEHFIDLCRMLGQPTPNEADPTGEWYAFEKGAEKLGGGDGFADVWKRGHFAWEYKGKRKDLSAAYRQLKYYCQVLPFPVRFHDLCHSAATFLLAQGCTLEDVKNLLGHSTIVLTSNTYGHVLEERQREVARGMDGVLGG